MFVGNLIHGCSVLFLFPSSNVEFRNSRQKSQLASLSHQIAWEYFCRKSFEIGGGLTREFASRGQCALWTHLLGRYALAGSLLLNCM